MCLYCMCLWHISYLPYASLTHYPLPHWLIIRHHSSYACSNITHHPSYVLTLSYASFKDISTTVRLSDLLRLMLCSSEAMVLYDTEDRIVHTNKAYTRMTGYTLSDVEGKNNYSTLQGPLTDVLAVQRCAVTCRKQEQVSSVTVTNYRKGWYTLLDPIS